MSSCAEPKARDPHLAAVGRLLEEAYARLEARERDERDASRARRAHNVGTCAACSPRLDDGGGLIAPLPWQHWLHELARDGLTDAQVAFNVERLRSEVRRLKAAGASSFPKNLVWRRGVPVEVFHAA